MKRNVLVIAAAVALVVAGVTMLALQKDDPDGRATIDPSRRTAIDMAAELLPFVAEIPEQIVAVEHAIARTDRTRLRDAGSVLQAKIANLIARLPAQPEAVARAGDDLRSAYGAAKRSIDAAVACRRSCGDERASARARVKELTRAVAALAARIEETAGL